MSIASRLHKGWLCCRRFNEPAGNATQNPELSKVIRVENLNPLFHSHHFLLPHNERFGVRSYLTPRQKKKRLSSRFEFHVLAHQIWIGNLSTIYVMTLPINFASTADITFHPSTNAVKGNNNRNTQQASRGCLNFPLYYALKHFWLLSSESLWISKIGLPNSCGCLSRCHEVFGVCAVKSGGLIWQVTQAAFKCALRHLKQSEEGYTSKYNTPPEGQLSAAEYMSTSSYISYITSLDCAHLAQC